MSEFKVCLHKGRQRVWRPDLEGGPLGSRWRGGGAVLDQIINQGPSSLTCTWGDLAAGRWPLSLSSITAVKQIGISGISLDTTLYHLLALYSISRKAVLLKNCWAVREISKGCIFVNRTSNIVFPEGIRPAHCHWIKLALASVAVIPMTNVFFFAAQSKSLDTLFEKQGGTLIAKPTGKGEEC